MKTAVVILSALAAAYVFFIVAPAITIFFAVFTKKHGSDVHKMRRTPENEEYAKKVFAAEDKLKAYETKRLSQTAFDGVQLFADYIDNGSEVTVMLVHGYRALPLTNFMCQAQHYAELGYNVLLPYERGHYVSGGNFIYLGLREYRDVLTWAEFAEKTCEKLVIYGISMGASSVAYSSDKLNADKVKALIIDCGYTSPYIQIKRDSDIRHMPTHLLLPVISLMARLILGIRLKDSVTEPLSHNKIPALFVHGEEDRTVPIENGVVNFEACASEKKFVSSPGSPHTLSFLNNDGSIKKAIDDFIVEHTGDRI